MAPLETGLDIRRRLREGSGSHALGRIFATEFLFHDPLLPLPSKTLAIFAFNYPQKAHSETMFAILDSVPARPVLSTRAAPANPGRPSSRKHDVLRFPVAETRENPVLFAIYSRKPPMCDAQSTLFLAIIMKSRICIYRKVNTLNSSLLLNFQPETRKTPRKAQKTQYCNTVLQASVPHRPGFWHTPIYAAMHIFPNQPVPGPWVMTPIDNVLAGSGSRSAGALDTAVPGYAKAERSSGRGS